MKITIGRIIILLTSLLMSCSSASPSATPLTTIATTQSTPALTISVQPTATPMPRETSVKFIWKTDLKMGGLTGISIDEQENVYVVDYNRNTVYKLDSTGQLITQWGERKREWSV